MVYRVITLIPIMQIIIVTQIYTYKYIYVTVYVYIHIDILHIRDYSHEQRSTARGVLAPNIYIYIYIHIYIRLFMNIIVDI